MSTFIYYIIFILFYAELLCGSEPTSIPTEALKDGQKLNSEHTTNASNSNSHMPTTTVETECKSILCVRKCCPPGMHYLRESIYCMPAEHEVNLQIPRPTDAPEHYVSDFQIIYKAICPHTLLLDPNEDFFELYKNGTLGVSDFGQRGVSEYCFEYSEVHNATTAAICYNSSTENSENSTPHDESNLNYYLFGISCSIFFLILTLIAHILVPQLRQPTYSKYLQCHILALTFQFICMIILQQVLIERGFVCTLMGYCMQFITLTSFFWLNAMCIDMWLSFRNKTFAGSMFLKYSFYAIGVPLIISLITLLIQFSNVFDNVNMFAYSIKPDVGHERCLFTNPMAKFFYFYFFIMIILIANIFLFVNMAMSIFKIQGKSKRPNFDKQQRRKYFLFLSLFLIMGLNWSAEVLSFLLKKDDGIYFVTDILNTFHGVFVFGIVVCRPRILYQLNKKLCPGTMCIRGPSEQTDEQIFETKFSQTVVETDHNSKTETTDLMN